MFYRCGVSSASYNINHLKTDSVVRAGSVEGLELVVVVVVVVVIVVVGDPSPWLLVISMVVAAFSVAVGVVAALVVADVVGAA